MFIQRLNIIYLKVRYTVLLNCNSKVMRALHEDNQAFFLKVSDKACEGIIQNFAYSELFWSHQNLFSSHKIKHYLLFTIYI